MQTLLKSTRAYKIVQAERQNGNASHAYMLLMDDPRLLRDALKAFAPLFFEDGERTEQLVESESFADCLFFPEKGKKLVVEDAEKIAEESALRPVEGDRKLFVISDFAEATPAAQNKLLKLLEEPPAGVYFLLGATTAYPVLTTVLSRVKKLEIPPFSEEELTAFLQRKYGDGGKYSPAEYALCAAASGGSMGGALNMLEGGAYKQVLDDAFSLATANSAELPILIKRIGETKRKKELLSLLRGVYRDALAVKLGKNKLLFASEKARTEECAKKYSLAALVRAQDCIVKAEKELFFNAYFPQCLEILSANIRENI